MNNLKELAVNGWTLFSKVLKKHFIDETKLALLYSEIQLEKYKEKFNLGSNSEGCLHHLPATVDSNLYSRVLEVICSELDEEIEGYFGSLYVLNSYGAVISRRGQHKYVSNWHRDIRTPTPNQNLMLNILVMLDEFTELNGGTLIKRSSHVILDREDLEENRFIGKAGDVVLFNSSCLHKAGENFTDSPRSCLTITLTKPFYKPQFDYCRLKAVKEFCKERPFIEQIYGFNSRIPSSLEEWYVPKEQRAYKEDQG